jgi:hypothetical protein
MNQKIKGSPVKSCPFSVPRGGTTAIAWPGLRQVIAEGGKDHVVNRLRSESDGSRRVVVPAPSVLHKVGVLDAPPQTALRSLINLVPEADRAFLDVAKVASALLPDGAPGVF